MTGDLRSGKQLLEDAPEDSSQTIHTLAHTQRGRILLGQLALYIESQLAAIDEKTVHRPLAFNLSTLSFDTEGPLVSLCASKGLAGMCTLWLFNLGYDNARMAHVLMTLPPAIYLVFERMVGMMHALSPAAMITHPLGSIQNHAAGCLAQSMESKACSDLYEEAQLEAETEVGASIIDFDPVTQRRKRFFINSRFASLWCEHREECLMRFAAHDASIWQTDICGICSFITKLLGALECKQRLYQRFCFGNGKTARAMLMCVTIQKSFNSLGHLTQVCGIWSGFEGDPSASAGRAD
jgi:hypothetical protein